MKSLGTIGAVILLAATLLAQPARAEEIELRGEIQRGETLVHSFEHHGMKMEFRLLPLAHGWSVWIGERADRNRNFVVPVAPPYRAVNPVTVEGWQFRNDKNTGPRKPAEAKAAGIGRTRSFGCVKDGNGYQAARESLEILSWPEGRAKEDLKSAEDRLLAIPVSAITLEVEAVELGNLAAGEKAWIERLAFRLRIDD